MGLRLEDLKTDTRTVTVAYRGHELHVTYKPSAYTPTFIRDMRIRPDGETQAEALVPMLTVLVQTWDLLDDKEKPLPITAELLGTLEIPFLNAIGTAINQDVVNVGEVAAS